MPSACDPSTVVAAAKCFECLNAKQTAAVQTYLLAQIAAGSMDPTTLARQAKCFQCLSAQQLQEIQVMLLCTIANASA